MDHNSNRLSELFKEYFAQTITAGERMEFFDYVQDPFYARDIQELISEAYENQVEPDNINEQIKTEVLNSILGNKQSINNTKYIRLWPRVAAVVAVIVTFGLAILIYKPKTVEQRISTNQINDVSPGKVAGTLTLASGKKISLAGVPEGQFANESGISITKTADGRLLYEIRRGGGVGTAHGKVNVLSTAKGEQYQVLLPDGSRVYLNALSSLKYPVSFNDEPMRKVELSGEAYFEIAKDKMHPFLVVANRQIVKVLGTHFNINAYGDEPDIKTTLLEGSVLINEHTILKPNQQAIVNTAGIRVVTLNNTQDLVSWKEGVFNFENDNLESVMRKIARWYNVEVVYQGKSDLSKTYSGAVSKADHISKVLKMLEESEGIHFRMEEDRKLIVIGD